MQAARRASRMLPSVRQATARAAGARFKGTFAGYERAPKPVSELNYDRAARRRLQMPDEVWEKTQPLRDLHREVKEHEDKAAAFETPWDVHCALVIERPPLVEEPKKWQWELEHLCEELFKENVWKLLFPDDPRMQRLTVKEMMEAQPEDKARAYLERAVAASGVEVDPLRVQQAVARLRRLLESEPHALLRAPEDNGDRHNLERHRREPLFFLVRHRRDTLRWDFPSLAVPPPDGDFVETAQFAGSPTRIGEMRWWLLSRAPQAFHAYAYPESRQSKTGTYGRKTFYYRAVLLKGGTPAEPKLSDRRLSEYGWVTRSEARKQMDADLWRALQFMLV